MEVAGRGQLLDDQPWIKQSMQLRDIYTDPLNYLQAELLQRNREHSESFLQYGLGRGIERLIWCSLLSSDQSENRS